MRSSKIYSILEHFDKYEQNRFRKYLSSPYFNKDSVLISLLEILLTYINSSSRVVSIEREEIWTQLDLHKKFNDVRFRKYCSDLLKHMEGFLTQRAFEENPLHQANYLLEAVGDKKMEKLYNGSMKTARRLSDSQKYRPSSYYFYQYQIEKSYYDLIDLDTRRTKKTNAEEIANNLDFFYFAEKLRIYCEALNRQYLVSQEYEFPFIDEIIKHVKQDQYQEIPPIAVYLQVYYTITEEDNLEHYYKLKSLLGKYGLVFPKQEALTLYYSAINYCIRQSNQGKQNFLEELFFLYKELIDKEIIFVNNELSPWDFKNIIVSALRLGKYDWTENFIMTYNIKLPDQFRENAVTYNLATLYFYQKNYEKVIEQLRNVEYEDIIYNLNSKTMLLATYFETDEFEALYFLFESFRTYLNRHKDIPQSRRNLYINLIKFTKKLTKIRPGDKVAVDKIKKEVNETGNIASLNWLKQKIAELEA